MRFKRGRLKLEVGEYLDLAPLIDIIFLLLIFFLLTWNFLTQSQAGIKVNLPKAVTSEAIAEESLIINITGENLIYLNDKIVTTRELISKLEGLSPRKKSLLIKADRRASLGRVVEVWDICRNAGISQVNIATTQTEE
ncbi:MAG: hypothetical protein AMJ78_10025 [Omnitrophica WOR_2 bacterium SM23_29]|nr:MAG: hypothetical protein AMJ78_10025 [Omnitrophica WOR_2 bacterium SM23_29]